MESIAAQAALELDQALALELYATGIADAVLDGKSSIPDVPSGDDEFVAHEVMADQGDPRLDGGVVGGTVEDLALARDDLGDRAGVDAAVDVPSPRAERSTDADGIERGEDALRVRHGAGLDRERHLAVGAAEHRHRNERLVVLQVEVPVAAGRG